VIPGLSLYANIGVYVGAWIAFCLILAFFVARDR
jgi:hypothetical protein